MKECVTIKVSGEPSVTVQKRILIHDLADLYKNWIKDSGLEIVPCLAFFASIKPKQCIYAGDPGSHNICVCCLHQNVKLKLSAVLPCINYKEVIESGVCSVENKNCMLKKCDECPKEGGIHDFLKSSIGDRIVENVSYSNWTSESIKNANSESSSDARITLKNFTEPSGQFLQDLSKDIYDLIEHHYVSLNQKNYFTECKQSLDKDTGLFIMDFAENYSYICQNSTQGFYFNNKSASLFTVVLYYKDKEGSEIKHKSYCVISDSLVHQAYSVHKFMEVVLDDMKKEFPWIQKLIYFSDGAPTQFKNK